MTRNFVQLIDQPFDVLVCDGGIYGAWTAYDTALRGMKVAIVDQGDGASGTSSASSKWRIQVFFKDGQCFRLYC